MSEIDDKDLPEMEPIKAEESKSLIDRFKRASEASPVKDPHKKHTVKLMLSIGAVMVLAAFLFGQKNDNSIDSLRYDRNAKINSKVAQQGMLSPEEEQKVLDENEEQRRWARANGENYSPNNMALSDVTKPNEAIPAFNQVTDICRATIEDGIAKKLPVETIAANAARAAADMAKSRNLPTGEVIKATQECTQLAASMLGLTTEQTIMAAAAAAAYAAQIMGLSEEEQVEIAARAAAEMAKLLGLSEEEQVAYAARAAQQTAAALGWSEERQVEAAAKAAADTAKRLGWSEERIVDAAAKAAMDAAARLGWSEERQVEAAAKAAADAAKRLGWSEERIVDAAAKAAMDAAKRLGWSEERQIAAAAKAAADTAKRLGWSEERQIAAAAKAAMDAAARLGWSEEDQIRAAAQAAQETAKRLGWSEERQIDAAAKAALDAAKRLGLNEDQQIEAAYRAAKDAAERLGLSPDKQIKAAAKAALDASRALGQSEEQQLAAVEKATRILGTAAGMDAADIEDLVSQLVGKAETAMGRKPTQTQNGQGRSNKGQRSNHDINTVIATLIEQRNTQKATKNSADQYRQIATITRFPVVEPTADTGVVVEAAPTDTTTEDLALAVSAGTFLYGVQLTRVNTDIPAKEVVATLVGGPFSGAKIIGQWTPNGLWGETIGLVFNRMNFKGEEIPNVQLVAFHPETNLPGFATEVDNHYLQRFVGVAMRAMGAGASAAINARRELIRNLNDEGQTTGIVQGALDYELAQELFFARGAEEIGKFGERYESRPITIDTYNESMKLLVMNNLYLPTKFATRDR